MNALSNLRIPTAFVVALLITCGLFYVLDSMTDVEFQVIPLESREILFTRQVEDTPPQTKRVIDKPAREDLVVVKLPPLTGSRGPDIAPIATSAAPDTADAFTVDINRFSGTDSAPVPVLRVPPIYPQRAAANGTEGWVRVRFTISQTGAVIDPVVVESSPNNVFDDAALKAITRWRYNPKVENGVAVELRGIETLLRFTLE